MISDNIPERIVLLGIQPEKLKTGIYITKSVEKSIDKVINAVLEELKEAGFTNPSTNENPTKSLFWS